MSKYIPYILLGLGFILLAIVRGKYWQEVQKKDVNIELLKKLKYCQYLAYFIFLISFILTLK